MKRWSGLLFLAVVFWLGAFSISLLVAEWRKPDLGPIENQAAQLREDVHAMRSQIGIPTTQGATATPQARAVSLTPGTEVKVGAARITVVGIETGLGPGFGPLDARVVFILEGPHHGALAQSFKVVDEDWFVCEGGINAETGVALGPGEKTRFWIYYKCAEEKSPKTLSLDNITFEFPPP